MAGSSNTTRKKRWLQFSLRTLLVLFIVCPLAAWWSWQWSYEIESIVTAPPAQRPAGHTGPWPPKEYFRREVRTVRRGKRNEPIRHGSTVTYDRSGAKVAEEHWADDLLDGPTRAWHPNGQLAVEGQFARGEMDGTWHQWDATGQPIADQHYDHDVPVGKWVEYARGQKAVETQYENGVRRSLTRHQRSPSGPLVRIETFDHGGLTERKETVKQLSLSVALGIVLDQLELTCVWDGERIVVRNRD